MVVFYYSRGLDQGDVFDVQAVISLAGMATGIVCGHWTDSYGVRKISLVAAVLLTMHSVLFYVAQGPAQYQLMGFLLGLIWSLMRNATSTLMRAQLKDRLDEYKTYEQFAALARNVGIVLSLVAGDVMVRIDKPEFDLPFACQPVIYGASVIVAWRIHETEYSTARRASVVKETLQTLRVMLRERRDVRWFVVFTTVLYTTTLSSFWLFQPVLEDAGVAETHFGWIYIARVMLVGVLTMTVSWYDRFSMPTICALLLVITVGSLATSAMSDGLVVPIMLMVGHSVVTAVDIQLMRVMLAKIMPASLATELSVTATVQALGFAVVSPFFGRVADSASSSAALMAIATFAVFAGGASVLLFRRSLA